MTRNTKHLHTSARFFIGIVCSLLIIGSSALLLILHNTASSQNAQQNNHKTATAHHAHATSTPTPITPTSTTTETGITPTPTPLFSDNFIDNSQGWYVNNSEGYTRSLTPNGLTLTDTNHNPMIESLPTNHKFDDFILTTTLTLKQSDTNDDSAGVYLRGDSNLDHDYRIDIFGNNTYAITKEYLDTYNTPQALYIIAPSHATSLKARGTPNTLTIIMTESTLILFINNKLVNVIIDEDYTHGQIALFVANSATSAGVTAVFSSITINAAPTQFPVIAPCPATPVVNPNEGTPTTCNATCTATPTPSIGVTPSTCK
jgi:Domain of Unknown Function (DUF1080)